MKAAKRDGFGEYHPTVCLAWFVAALGFSMTLKHPVCLTLSLLGAIAYAITRNPRKAWRDLAISMPMLLLTVVMNPLFSHEGITILRYLPDGNPLTLESICYGLVAGSMLATTILLFFTMTGVFTSDKLAYLLSKAAPALGLIFSMTLSFVPRFRHHGVEVLRARRALKGGNAPSSGREKWREAGRVISAMAAWCLEGSMATADSMRCRGYGMPGRTAFHLWRFETRDAILMAGILVLSGYVLAGQLSGAVAFAYYPAIAAPNLSPYGISVMASQGLLFAVPAAINIWEDFRWHSLTSGT